MNKRDLINHYINITKTLIPLHTSFTIDGRLKNNIYQVEDKFVLLNYDIHINNLKIDYVAFGYVKKLNVSKIGNYQSFFKVNDHLFIPHHEEHSAVFDKYHNKEEYYIHGSRKTIEEFTEYVEKMNLKKKVNSL